MNVNRYVNRMKKKILKISKNLFGLDNFPSLFKYMVEVRGMIESVVGKNINDFTDDNIKAVALDYAVYKTCKKLCDIYLFLAEFQSFEMPELIKEKY